MVYYADSSFLVSLYRRDAHQEAANRFMERHAPPLGFSPLNRIELRNALRNAHGAGDMREQDLRAALRQIDIDISDAVLLHLSVNWSEVFHRADELSAQHATGLGQRTIDLLHVAIAVECGAKTFLTFDRRQAAVAKAAGLTVKP